MSPLGRSNNVAAGMGRWSASHSRQPSSGGSRSSSPRSRPARSSARSRCSWPPS